jgi:hypothetical protein
MQLGPGQKPGDSIKLRTEKSGMSSNTAAQGSRLALIRDKCQRNEHDEYRQSAE